MKYLFIFVSVFCFSQNIKTAEVELLDKTSTFEKGLIHIDDFNTSYSLQNNTLYKSSNGTTINYSNVQLGKLESVNLFNPLKINLFYKDFNTVIILDNRLAEIFKIDFNTSQNYKNVLLVSTGGDNTIWIYNQETQRLELFDYKTNKLRVNTVPIQSNVLDLKSDYNYCWLLTEDYIYEFNYFGSLMQKIKNEGFTSLEPVKGNLMLRKENDLFYLEKDAKKPIPINLPKLLINAFFVKGETLYIYDTNSLYKYQLKIN